MRTPLALLLLAGTLLAGDFGRTLRALRTDDREARREALEALADGRQGPATASERKRLERELKRFLSERALAAERALAVRALGRHGVYEPLLRALPGERDDRVLDAAAGVFRRAPGELAGEIADLLAEAEDPLGRAVLLRMLGELPGREARVLVRQRAAIADHWCPRAAALHALATDRHADALPPLVAALDTGDDALVTAAVDSLTRLTGMRYGRKPIEWKAWWNTHGKDDPFAATRLKPRDPGRKPDAHRYAHETDEDDPWGPYYFGIPVRGKDVVFVFDVSASMRYKLPLAFDELTRAVKGLRPAGRFEVIFFNEFVWPWRGRLSRADPVTKELLVRHLPTLEVKSYTNLFDSIERALAMEPDEIFVISDGEPNRGRKQLPKHILSELERINEAKIPIHTISVIRRVDGDEHIDLLRQIAEAHGGEHVERTLR